MCTEVMPIGQGLRRVGLELSSIQAGVGGAVAVVEGSTPWKPPAVNIVGHPTLTTAPRTSTFLHPLPSLTFIWKWFSP